MINPEIFFIEMSKLSAWFNKEIPEAYLFVMQELMDKELTTEQFVQACQLSVRNNKFFPTPAEMIESVIGTLEERAIAQWASLDRLSAVGQKALDSIGGILDLNQSPMTSIPFYKKDFIAAYVAFAKFAKPEDLQMPVEVNSIALGGSPYKLVADVNYFYFVPHMTRLNKSGDGYEFLWRYESFKEKPTNEAGLKILLDCVQKSVNTNRLRRIIDGVHILHEPTGTLQRAFDAPEQQQVIEDLKSLALRTETKQIELYGPRETWVSQ